MISHKRSSMASMLCGSLMKRDARLERKVSAGRLAAACVDYWPVDGGDTRPDDVIAYGMLVTGVLVATAFVLGWVASELLHRLFPDVVKRLHKASGKVGGWLG
jgi:hypothetical protein